jgi:hypothetical protein
VHVTRDNLIVTVDNADERLFHVVTAHTACMQQRPLSGPLNTLLHYIASHFIFS